MNYVMIRYLIGWMLGVEAIFLLLPALTAVLYQEPVVLAYLGAAVICLAFAGLFCHKKPENTRFYAREGFVTVALCWIVLAVTGALPFLFSGEIPSVVDALFETVSGFTTTGATILTDVEAISHASLLWRSLTHWVGGMGVLVFMLIILPLAGGQTIHLMRAAYAGYRAHPVCHLFRHDCAADHPAAGRRHGVFRRGLHRDGHRRHGRFRHLERLDRAL